MNLVDVSCAYGVVTKGFQCTFWATEGGALWRAGLGHDSKFVNDVAFIIYDFSGFWSGL